MNKNQERKLCYILPEAAENTHMKYNVEFILSLAKERGVDIYLIIERGKVHEDLKEMLGVKYLKFIDTKSSFIREIKTLYFLTQARLKGYKKVYVHYSFIGAFLASISNPRKQVYYWNCGIPWQYKRPFFQELYESMTYKLVDHFVTGAKVLTEQYAKFYNFDNKKSIVIPNWIDIKSFLEVYKHTDTQSLRSKLNISLNKKVLFFNQRLAERKGANYIPQILDKCGDDVVMIITNDGPYKEKLKEILDKKGFADRVRFLGRVPNIQVIELFTIVDIYILPSEEEGMSHSLMEAMCASVPAVAYDVGGTIDMYPESMREYVVPEKNINWFCEKVVELLNDQGKRNTLGNALFEKVKEYDKKVVLDIFIEKVLDAE